MIRELGLSDEELGDISLTITNLAEKARRRRVRRTSSNSSGLVGQVSERLLLRACVESFSFAPPCAINLYVHGYFRSITIEQQV